MLNKKAYPKYLNILISIALIIIFFYMFLYWYSYEQDKEVYSIEETLKQSKSKFLISSYLSYSEDQNRIDEIISSFYTKKEEGKDTKEIEERIKTISQNFFSRIYEDDVHWKIDIEGKEIENNGKGTGKYITETIEMPLLSFPSMPIKITLTIK